MLRGSMTPDAAVGAAVQLRAKTVVPIHYGLHDPARYLEHPRALESFTELAKARGLQTDVSPPGRLVTAYLNVEPSVT